MSTTQVKQIERTVIKPHPFNATLYQDSERNVEFQGLVASIKTHGFKEPLVITPENVLLSGHRRLAAAEALGIEKVPCLTEETDNEELSIVEHNRYRKKTYTELMREAQHLTASEKEKVAAMRYADPSAEDVGDRKKGQRTQAIVAKALGIGSGTNLHKLQKIFEASKSDPKIAAQMDKIDSGEKSINAVFKSLNVTAVRKEDFGLDLQLFSSWHFPVCDVTLGQDHPGRIPGQIVENLIYYYTNPGNLVVDPFGGGGVTVDASKNLRRPCYVTDIAPVRSDIHPWNISEGYPPEAQDAQFVLLDPPYWNMLEKEYKALHAESSATLSLDDFREWLLQLLHHTHDTLQDGGVCALIIMPQSFKLPEGIPFVDWPFEVRSMMDEVGFVPLMRISHRWPTSIYNAPQVERAKDTKTFLITHGDIVIGKKVM